MMTKWIMGAMLMAAIAACASTQPADAQAPCGPSDCAPCDETKGKCMGPSVCDNHPEKAKRVCARNATGACVSTLVCE